MNKIHDAIEDIINQSPEKNLRDFKNFTTKENAKEIHKNIYEKPVYIECLDIKHPTSFY